MSELLDRIIKENDIKNIDSSDYDILAKEIRRFLVKCISHTGGHLSSNLGVVELTMAMHLCMNFPEDKLIWDVGHQCYTHKILTGRKEEFKSLRKFGGISGFPKRAESPCDSMDTGHSSTSIGMALGFVKAREINKQNYNVFAVIGDGALSGGMAYEALNNASRLKSNMIIVLNDNEMSISKNVGGMSNYLGKIRTNTNYTEFKEDIENTLNKVPHIGEVITGKIRGAKNIIKRMFIPGMLFEDMGITYIGPIDGHNIKQMTMAFESAKKLNKAVLVHVITQKGKGYSPAMKDPSAFHGVSPFFVKDGKPRVENEKKISYTDVFSKKIVEIGENKKIAAISAAMLSGTGLTEFSKKYPERFFDVGIAEEHAVCFASGIAAGGVKPVVAIYSTFLQRSYDQIMHDVCINKVPVVFAVDRAGLVGSDGETHQGIFDIAFLRQMPGMTVMAPKNTMELQQMLDFAVELDAPSAIRYPRGEAYTGLSEFSKEIELGKSEWIYREKDIALLAFGSMVQTAVKVRETLKEKGYNVSLINARFAKPLDIELLNSLEEEHRMVVAMEEGVITGGFCEAISSWYKNSKVKVCQIALPDKFIEHGSVEQLREKYKIDVKSIVEKILDMY